MGDNRAAPGTMANWSLGLRTDSPAQAGFQPASAWAWHEETIRQERRALLNRAGSAPCGDGWIRHR